MEKALRLPSEFQSTIALMWKEEGEKWLHQLPDIIEACSKKWSLDVGECVRDLSISYVSYVTLPDGAAAILKIGCPHPELYTEMDALEAFGGKGSVKLLQKDKELGALLLERIEPGTMLAELQRQDEKQATHIAAQLIHAISIPPEEDMAFPRVKDWTANLEHAKSLQEIPTGMIERAQQLADTLEHSKKEEKLLHGDLHHTNILFDERRGWLAIDPKGVIGDPAFNAARFLRNGGVLEARDPMALSRNRVAILSSAMQREPFRVAGWGYVDCMIGACWSAEGGGDGYKYALGCAKILDGIIKDTNS